MRIIKILDSESIQVEITQSEAAWLGNSLNEVVHGIQNIKTDEVLLIPKSEASEVHDKFVTLYKAQPWIEEKATIVILRKNFALFRRAIIAVMRDFNKYNEYHVRLGVEFDEYLDLLSDINRILEESC